MATTASSFPSSPAVLQLLLRKQHVKSPPCPPPALGRSPSQQTMFSGAAQELPPAAVVVVSRKEAEGCSGGAPLDLTTTSRARIQESSVITIVPSSIDTPGSSPKHACVGVNSPPPPPAAGDSPSSSPGAGSPHSPASASDDTVHGGGKAAWKCNVCGAVCPDMKTVYTHYYYHQQQQFQQAGSMSPGNRSPARKDKSDTGSDQQSEDSSGEFSPALRSLLITDPINQNNSNSTGFLKSLVKSVIHEGQDARTFAKKTEDSRHSTANTQTPKKLKYVKPPDVLGTVTLKPNGYNSELTRIKTEPSEVTENRSPLSTPAQPDVANVYSVLNDLPTISRSRKRKPSKRFSSELTLDTSSFDLGCAEYESPVAKKVAHNSPEVTAGANKASEKTFRDIGIMCLIIDPYLEESQRVRLNNVVTDSGSLDSNSFMTTTTRPYRLSCDHCGLHFDDPVMHSIHMGSHSHTDPFQCNICGDQCDNRYSFYTHLMRGHQT